MIRTIIAISEKDYCCTATILVDIPKSALKYTPLYQQMNTL